MSSLLKYLKYLWPRSHPESLFTLYRCISSLSWIIVLCVYFVHRCLSFSPFSFGHYVICSSSIYGFWLPLWYLPTLLCPFGHYVFCPSLINGLWLPLWYLPTLRCPFGHYVVCPSLIDGFWLPLWYLQTFLVTYITYLKIDNNTKKFMFVFLRLNSYSQICPCGHLYWAVSCIKRSPFSCLFIENLILIEPLYRGHLSYKAIITLSQRWPLNTGLIVYITDQ